MLFKKKTPPIFYGSNFMYWKHRMQIFVKSIDYDFWMIIENGFHLPRIDINGIARIKLFSDWLAHDAHLFDLNAKAINLLFSALHVEISQKFSSFDFANDIWKCLVTLFEGTNEDGLVTTWSKKEISYMEKKEESGILETCLMVKSHEVSSISSTCYDKLQLDFDKLTRKYTKLKTFLKEVYHEFNEIIVEKESLENKLDDILKEKEELENEIDSLKDKNDLENSHFDYNVLLEEFSDLTSKYDSLKTFCKNLSNEFDEIINEKDILQNEYDALEEKSNEEVRKLKSEINDLKTSLSRMPKILNCHYCNHIGHISISCLLRRSHHSNAKNVKQIWVRKDRNVLTISHVDKPKLVWVPKT